MGRITTKTTVIDDDTGEIIRESLKRGTQNGGGWVIIYRDALLELGRTAPLTAWKVFASLGATQDFEKGIKTTKRAIAEKMNMSYNNVMRGFNWLKENGYIKERKTDGQTEFLINPDITTCGRNKKKKFELWNSI